MLRDLTGPAPADIRTFSFTYAPGDPNGLSELQEKNGTTVKGLYKFGYYGWAGSATSTLTTAIDFWGYGNYGYNNASLTQDADRRPHLANTRNGALFYVLSHRKSVGV